MIMRAGGYIASSSAILNLPKKDQADFKKKLVIPVVVVHLYSLVRRGRRWSIWSRRDSHKAITTGST